MYTYIPVFCGVRDEQYLSDLTQTDSDDVTTYLALIIGVADVTRSRFVSRFTSAKASLAANNPIK